MLCSMNTGCELWVFEWICIQLKVNCQPHFTGTNSILNTRCHCSILLIPHRAPIRLKLYFQVMSKLMENKDACTFCSQVCACSYMISQNLGKLFNISTSHIYSSVWLVSNLKLTVVIELFYADKQLFTMKKKKKKNLWNSYLDNNAACIFFP